MSAGKKLAITLVVVILIFTLVAVVYTRPLATKGSDHVLGHFGEAILDIYIISWTSRTLFSNPANLFNTTMFYPNRYTLAYSDIELTNSLVALPVLALSDNPVLSFNFALILSFIISSLGAFLLVYHLSRDVLGALAGGLIFGFPIYKIGHIAHLNLLATGFIPLAILCLHLFTEKKKPIYALLFAILAAAVFLTSWSYGAFLTFAVILYLLILLVMKRKQIAAMLKGKCVKEDRLSARRWVVYLAAATVLVILILTPFVIPYLKLAKDNSGFRRGIQEVEYYSADVSDFMAAPSECMVWGGPTSRFREEANKRAGIAERALFPGIIAPVLALFGLAYLWRRRRGKNRFTLFFYSLLMICSAVLCLGVTLHIFGRNTGITMPYKILYYVFPALRAVRTPARMFILVLLCLAVLGGFGIKWLKEKLESRYNTLTMLLVVILVLVLLVVEVMPSGIKATELDRRSEFPPVYDWLEDQVGDTPTVILPLPAYKPETPDLIDKYIYSAVEPLRLYYNTADWKRMVNGYSGYIPASYYEASIATADFPSDESLAFLRGLGVKYVIFEGARYDHYSRARALYRPKYDPSFKMVQRFDNTYVFQLL